RKCCTMFFLTLHCRFRESCASAEVAAKECRRWGCASDTTNAAMCSRRQHRHQMKEVRQVVPNCSSRNSSMEAAGRLNIILFGGQACEASSGEVRFIKNDGSAFNVMLH